jgi:hypothetical protein
VAIILELPEGYDTIVGEREDFTARAYCHAATAASEKIALLGSYMASSFAVVGENNGGSLAVTPVSQDANHPFLVMPHHS